MKLFLAILIVVFSFSQKAFAGDMQGFMNAMEKAKDSGFTLDPSATAKEYGYKNFESFAKEYLVAHDIDPKDISVEEVKEFLLGTDRTIEIVQSQENLDKLHSLIVNDKYFRKKTSYFKKKYEKKTKLLVVYMNYEKEMAKISKDPDLEKIGRFGFRFRYWKNDGYYSIDGLKEGAFKDCEKKIKKKYKLSGGECVLVEYRVGDRYENLLKPRKIKKLENNKILAKLSKTQSDPSVKKLKFKESGPFYGIKKNNLMIRGVYKLPENENAQTDYYGLFTKNEMFWKGYSHHRYKDGRVVYQYNEYKLDKDGKVLQDENGIFQLVDSYLITAEDFEKVKEYIVLDIDLPFSFYDFDIKESKTKIAKKDTAIKKKNESSSSNENLKIVSNEKYYALVIGNNNYEYLEKLDAAENDAEVIADVLTNKYGFEVDLLLNADYDTTVNSLFKITNKLKRNDNLLIYYAGHGELDKAENRGYWLPVDASYELRSKWISNQRIVDRIKATKAKHVLLIADSCFSGTLMRSGTTPDVNEAIDEKYIERLKSKKTRLVITSGGNEPVVDSDGGNHSLFALKLIDTLKNNNTVINSQILFENIRRYVVSNADQTPERALVHKTGHDGGDFLFFPKE